MWLLKVYLFRSNYLLFYILSCLRILDKGEKMTAIKKHTVFLLFISMLSVNAYAQEGGSNKKGRRGPPPEALTACEGLEVEQACSFTSRRRGEVAGICIVPKSDDSALACKPERGSKKK